MGRDGPVRPSAVLGVALLALALQGPARAQDAARRTSTPVVVDASGRVIGPAFGTGVLVEVRGRLAVLLIGRSQFTGGGASVVFEAAGCAGPPFLKGSDSDLLEAVGVGPPNVLIGPAGPPESRTIRSRWVAGITPASCVEESPATLDVRPGEPLMNLAVFAPPFRID